MNQPQGEVFDIGYQPYEGAREGRNAARKALLIDGMRTALGMGRGLTAKILPICPVPITKQDVRFSTA